MLDVGLQQPQSQKQSILERYGGSEHLEVPDARLLVGQTESYVEYDRTGRVVKGAPKVKSVGVLTLSRCPRCAMQASQVLEMDSSRGWRGGPC